MKRIGTEISYVRKRNRARMNDTEPVIIVPKGIAIMTEKRMLY